MYKLYQFDIFLHKYLSQGLIAILRKITQVTAAEREVDERRWGLAPPPPPRQSDTRENNSHSKYEALTQCCSTIGPTSSRRHDIKTTLGQCLELPGLGYGQSANSRR